MHRPAAQPGPAAVPAFPTAATRLPEPPCRGFPGATPRLPSPHALHRGFILYGARRKLRSLPEQPASGPACWHRVPSCPPQLHASPIKPISVGARRLFCATRAIGLIPGERKSSFPEGIPPLPIPRRWGPALALPAEGFSAAAGSGHLLPGTVLALGAAPARCRGWGRPRWIRPLPVAGAGGGCSSGRASERVEEGTGPRISLGTALRT